MKIKEGIDVWRCFELALDEHHRRSRYELYYHPINDILELEDTDWLNAIQICKAHKKYNLKKEIESRFSDWKTNPNEIDFTNWLDEFKRQICSTRKYTKTANDIRIEVEYTFRAHIELLNKFEKLNRLFSTYWKKEYDFILAKDDYEKATRNMEAFKSIKNSGITPEDFDWGLIEPEQKEKR
jgi:hypothetical protein